MTKTATLSRRELLAAGGALVVSFGTPAKAQIRTGSFAPYIVGPSAMNTELDSWLTIHANNTATLLFRTRRVRPRYGHRYDADRCRRA